MAIRAGDGSSTAPFILSLIAGVVILAGSGMMMSFAVGAPYYGGMMGGYQGMTNGYYGMMRGFGFGGLFYILTAIGVISGIIILVCAIMIYTRPKATPTWGAIIITFSLVSLFGMGGFFFGAILGAVGGMLALTLKSNRTSV